MNETEHIAILAYGSLIWNPGDEIKQHTISVLDVICPFKIEYARKSSTREDAPVLVKLSDEPGKTNAKLFVTDLHTSDENKAFVKEMIRQREDCGEKYVKVLEKPLKKFSVIFYADLPKNMDKVNINELADLAIKSVEKCKKKGKPEKNGIRYLLNNIKSGVITELTDSYANKIMEITKTDSLEEAETKELKRVD